MSLTRHEIPTHLNVEDKAFYGLSARQAMILAVGASGAYSLWGAWSHMPLAPRLALVGACVLAALVLAFLRPYGRGLEDWLFVGLRYLALPKTCVWRPRQDDTQEPARDDEAWATFTPTVAWREEAT